MPRSPLRLGIVGGHRGSQLNIAIGHHRDRLRLTAVCDIDPAPLAEWSKQDPSLATFTSYEKMLQSDTCDAIYIVTPMGLHTQQAIAALRAGKHVLSEVTACVTHEEGLALIAAVEETGMTYMMAENYIYMRPHMIVENMVQRGVFGELTYAEGMYLHDCRPLMFNKDGSLTWRGQMVRDMSDCCYYPTHSLGPIARWLDIGRTDQIESVMCMCSPPHGMSYYAQRRFGNAHAGADSSYWSRGDSSTCLIKTKLGRMIHLRVDVASQRPHHQYAHELQGTRAAFRTPIIPENDPLVWIDGHSTVYDNEPYPEPAKDWENLYKYADEFDDPRWKKFYDKVIESGHCGGDYFIFDDFINVVAGEIPNPVDVYDAVTWSSILWLSGEAAETERAVRAVNYRDLIPAAVSAGK